MIDESRTSAMSQPDLDPSLGTFEEAQWRSLALRLMIREGVLS